ncbi:MAG TPA: SAM-dependent methyltransferase [Paludibacter sp.]|nr:SAM-dependent methyltransferase [Paludibacter sp.]
MENYIRQKELIRLTLAAKRDKMSDLKKLIVSPVELKRGYCLNFVYRHNTKDITKNFDIEEGLKLLQEALENDFRNADLFAKSENLNLVIQPGGNVQLKSHPPTLSTSLSFVHDKPKERLVNTRNNVYLRELGIMNANGELRREMGDKYKQINQYIELLAPTLKELPHNESYSVADMGSGKGYLTFALYDYLTNGLKHAVSMRGIEFRQDLVDTCNNIARKADFENLEFIKGAIENTELEKIDVLIALHACDTATDDAIFRGISSGAELIVCAPCCHKQIRKAMNVANELSNITRFGILKERQAEIITDTIRAMILEAYGYKTNVIEFVSLEHTPKNVMIVGRKIPGRNPGRDKILGEIDAIKKIYGIEKHYLESLLNI